MMIQKYLVSFTNWMKDISELTKNEIIVIDGKYLKGQKMA